MKIDCVKEKLLEAVQKTEKMTGKNLTLPILSSILLEASPSKITLRSTNLDIGIECSLPAKVNEVGVVALSGNTFLQFLINLPGQRVSLETVEGGVQATSEGTSAIIKTQVTEDFPIIPKVSEGISFIIPPQEFVAGLKSVWYSSAITSIKPELSSVYIYQEKDFLIFVATDSFRLAEKRVKIKNLPDFGSILIPFKNVVEIIRVLEGVREDVTISLNSNQISFAWNDTYVVSRIINGTFPDYQQIIPKDSKTEATILKQDLIQVLKLANVFSDTFHQVTFRVVPGEKLFSITTKNNNLGENDSTVEAVLKGEDVTISFNYKYITDCFQSIPADSLILYFQGLGKPLVVKGGSDQSFTYLVMPMNR